MTTNPGTPPSVTTLGPFPSRTAAEDTYDAEMDTALDTLEDFPTEQNAVTAWQEDALTYAEFIQSELETLQTDVNTSTGANVTAAEDAQTAAESARDIAEGFANYQGDYDAGTLYAIGESVIFLGVIYVKKSTAAAGTTPAVGADWHLAYSAVVKYSEFTESGIWTKPPGVSGVLVEALGAGGAGGLSGGQGACFSSKFFRADQLADTETVTVGASGPGLSGGTSFFGAHVGAKGGAATLQSHNYANGNTSGNFPSMFDGSGSSDASTATANYLGGGAGGMPGATATLRDIVSGVTLTTPVGQASSTERLGGGGGNNTEPSRSVYHKGLDTQGGFIHGGYEYCIATYGDLIKYEIGDYSKILDIIEVPTSYFNSYSRIVYANGKLFHERSYGNTATPDPIEMFDMEDVLAGTSVPQSIDFSASIATYTVMTFAAYFKGSYFFGFTVSGNGGYVQRRIIKTDDTFGNQTVVYSTYFSGVNANNSSDTGDVYIAQTADRLAVNLNVSSDVTGRAIYHTADGDNWSVYTVNFNYPLRPTINVTPGGVFHFLGAATSNGYSLLYSTKDFTTVHNLNVFAAYSSQIPKTVGFTTFPGTENIAYILHCDENSSGAAYYFYGSFDASGVFTLLSAINQGNPVYSGGSSLPIGMPRKLAADGKLYFITPDSNSKYYKPYEIPGAFSDPNEVEITSGITDQLPEVKKTYPYFAASGKGGIGAGGGASSNRSSWVFQFYGNTIGGQSSGGNGIVRVWSW